MYIIYLLIVVLNIIAAPGYLSTVRLETDRSIWILATISTLLPFLVITLYPYQIINTILIQVVYVIVGIVLTLRS